MPLFKRKSSRRKMLHAPGFPQISGAGYRSVLAGLETQVAPDWYLEIGSRTGSSLKDRKCSFVAVDPEFKLVPDVFNASRAQLFFQEESDTFFEGGFLARAGISPQLAFIDGMHLIDYVLRDFRNTEAAMAAGGVIALHDILPFNAEMTTRELSALDEIDAWTGDVWKIIPILQKYRPDLVLEVVGAPRTGILVVRNIDPNNRTLFDAEHEIFADFLELDMADYGPDAFFGAFELQDPDRYIASL